MTRNLLLDATILLGLAILGVVGYKLAPLLNPKTDVALPLSSCNLSQQACVATLPDGGSIVFSIEQRPIQTLKTLQLQPGFSGSEVRKVEVDFAGTGMRWAITGRNGEDRAAATKTSAGTGPYSLRPRQPPIGKSADLCVRCRTDGTVNLFSAPPHAWAFPIEFRVIRR